jgi:hypothetical protein
MSFAKVTDFAVVESAAAASPTTRYIPHTKPMGRPWNRESFINRLLSNGDWR